MSGVTCYFARRDLDHDVARLLKDRNEFVQVGSNHLRAIRLLAVKSHVTSDRVLHPPLGEGGVMRHEHRPAVVGVDRDVIVISGWGETSSRRPTLVASLS
jgi:hypothetical protein